MCNKCSILISNGDMSPRFWFCDQTNQLKTFPYIQNLIKRYVDVFKLPESELLKIAHNFYKHKVKEHNELGTIYYCEDNFEEDLINYFGYFIRNNKENLLKEAEPGYTKFTEYPKGGGTSYGNLTQSMMDDYNHANKYAAYVFTIIAIIIIILVISINLFNLVQK